MPYYHAVVWLDHSEAHVMHFTASDVEKSVIHPSKPRTHLHAKSGAVGAGRQAEDKAYYHSVTESLKGSEEILVVGPAQAKLQLIKHIHAHDHDMSHKVVGVETVDHPSDGQLLAYARKYFIARERAMS